MFLFPDFYVTLVLFHTDSFLLLSVSSWSVRAELFGHMLRLSALPIPFLSISYGTSRIKLCSLSLVAAQAHGLQIRPHLGQPSSAFTPPTVQRRCTSGVSISQIVHSGAVTFCDLYVHWLRPRPVACWGCLDRASAGRESGRPFNLATHAENVQ